MNLMYKVNRAIVKQGGWKNEELNAGDVRRSSVRFVVCHNKEEIVGSVEVECRLGVPLCESIGFTPLDVSESIAFVRWESRSYCSSGRVSYSEPQDWVKEGFSLSALSGFDEALAWVRFSDDALREASARRKWVFAQMRKDFCLG